MEKNKCFFTNKRRYSTLGEAKNILINIKNSVRRYNEITKKRINKRCGKRSENRVYFCEQCKGYHITSSQIASVTSEKIKNKISNIKYHSTLFYTINEGIEWKKDSLPFKLINTHTPK